MESAWVVVLAAGALLVRAGQMLGAMGLARAKNVASAGFRSLADLCIATLAFWAIGSAILFQLNNQVIGIRADYLIGWNGLSREWFSMLAVVLIATGTIGPAISERSRLPVPLALGALLAGVLVPLVLFWTRFGWLDELEFIDHAGASAIHLVPALCAAITAVFVGARDGKYNRDGSSNMIPGHSVPMILMSVMLMLVGWVPYMYCVERALGPDAGANALIAAAAAGAASLVIAWVRFGKADILLTCGGILGGLVAITSAADGVGPPGAFLIGAIAGIIIPWITVFIDMRLKIDDPGGVIAIHGAGAIWGLIAAGLLAPAPIAQRFKLIGIQLLGIFVITVTTIFLAAIVVFALKVFMPLRSKEADEYDGLDLAEHDINAHPDFQQTMIKSYHLREA